MTLGKKLGNYRRVYGLTQQQIGERLNLSAQAISKWENDLAQPDLASLKELSKLYKTTLDELLDLDAPIHMDAADYDNADSMPEGKERTLIGFCKICGIAVDSDNVGTSEPVVKCKKCYDAEESEAHRAEAERIKRIEEEKVKAANEFANRQEKVKRRLTWSLCTASVVFIAVLILGISASASNPNVPFIGAIVLAYAAFSFTSLMFFDGIVSEVFIGMLGKSIQLPGLIFTLDLDGFIWLICMKILFWIIGIVVTIGAAVLGFLLALIMAPFVFPFKMVSIAAAIRNGDDSVTDI